MNYPNNIKKNTIKKTVTYGNRGMNLESIINQANEYYIEQDLAIIYKKPTPIGISKFDYTTKKITEAFFKEQSTLDYNGIYKGKYIEFDAKETKNKTSFPLNNIHEHQIKHMKNILNHGGICFLIIAINERFYMLSAKKIFTFLKNNERKSIPYIYIQENGFEITYNYLKGLDYIKGLKRMDD